jgi:hypothetical protein
LKGLIMKVRALLPLLLVPALLADPVHAGIIFGKKPPKPEPQQRVPELIAIARTNGDENRRIEAVEELRTYDPTLFPQIVPTLVEILMHDKKPGVRAEAASSLSKMRPVSQQAGQALEYARDNDPSMRVRLSARTSLVSYKWDGYKPGRKDERPLVGTQEPPLAGPEASPPPPAINTLPPPPSTTRPVAVQPVSQPTLQPVPRSTPTQLPVTPPTITTPSSTGSTGSSGGYRPLPSGPSQPAQTPPPANIKPDGPDLTPPE